MDINEAINRQISVIKDLVDRIYASGEDWTRMENDSSKVVSLAQVLETMCKEAKDGKTQW